MLSRVASRSILAVGRQAPVISVVPKRTAIYHAYTPDIYTVLENYEKADALFHGPERDYKNFPVWQMNDHPPPGRILGGLVPMSYFDFLFPKTGALGGYLLPFTVITALLSKEIMVVEHALIEVPMFFLTFAYLRHKVGDKIYKKFYDKSILEDNKRYYEPAAREKVQVKEQLEFCEKYISQLAGKKFIYETMRENVDLQLEEEYRKRLSKVHAAVQQRLNYQVAIEQTKRRFEQEHMSRWIIEKATQAITPQQEKDSLAKCIVDLKALAAKA